MLEKCNFYFKGCNMADFADPISRMRYKVSGPFETRKEKYSSFK
jgi:hypothetical protein